MKGSTIIFTIGGGILICAIVYGVYRTLRKGKKTNSKSVCATKVCTDESDFADSVVHSPQPERDLADAKRQTGASVYARHQEAGQIVNEAMNRIVNDNKDSDVVVTENSDTLNHMSGDLDDLLK